MDRVKRLIIEAHRRSLWQVLGVYLVSSWVVLQVADTLTGVLGLPGWVPSFGLVLLVIGLPIVMATAVVQEGGPVQAASGARPGADGSGTAEATASSPVPDPSPERTFFQRHLTWRRALLGGVGAFAFLGLLAGGYLLSWATGVGPFGSLLAEGTLEEGDRILLAEFRNSTNDPALGPSVTEALRVDLQQTPVVRVLEPGTEEVQGILAMMRADPEGPFTAELAREAALRGGYKAYLEGEIAPLGSGFVLTASLRSPQTGEALASFREAARGEEGLLDALTGLSAQIRERLGESLRSIHASPPMARVTTSSLEALRLYGEANRAFDRGDWRQTASLLEEALELDPEFAMAWLRLSAALGRMDREQARQIEAATRAFELRDRLTPRERLRAEAAYYWRVTRDRHAERTAYERMLELDPDDAAALNNLGAMHAAAGDHDLAVAYYRRAARLPGASFVPFRNLVLNQIVLGRPVEALQALEQWAERFPDHGEIPRWRFWLHVIRGNEAEARAVMEPLLSDPPQGRFQLFALASRTGRLDEARDHLERARVVREAQREYEGQLLAALQTAHLELALGDPERGMRVFRDAIGRGILDELAPPNRWHFFRAIVLTLAGHAREAEEVLRRFEEEVPEEFHARFRGLNLSALALVRIMEGEPQEAVRILEEIRQTMPCRFCYADRMGWALRDAGRLQEAAEEWETFLAWADLAHDIEFQAVRHAWVQQQIGPLYEELGDTERALYHYRRLADLWAEADEELQPVVRQARERIYELESAAGV